MSIPMSPVEPVTTNSNAGAFAGAGRTSDIAVRVMRRAATVAAAVAFIGLSQPVAAASPQDRLTSHLPWLAPVGHRQPRQADIRRNGVLSAWEREQQQENGELDRRLKICRGC